MSRARLLKIAGIVMANPVAGSFVTPRGLRNGIYRACGWEVSRSAVIYPRQVVRPGRVVVGDQAFVNTGGYFDPGAATITVGARACIGPGVIIAADTHEIGDAAQRAGANTARDITIGAGSWLGARVTVLAGVHIAPGCVIAAGAVVTRSTDPHGVYAGVPARRVRDLAP